MALRPPSPSAEDLDQRASPVRVLLADAYRPTRIGLRVVLEEHGLQVCAAVGEADDAVETAVTERPDVCLIDVRMPGGLDAAAQIASSLPDARVVVLASSDDVDELLAALRAGAAGYVLKQDEPECLVDAVVAACSDEVRLPRRLAAAVAAKLEELELKNRILEAELALPLSRRERIVLDLLREGCATDEIARRLYVEPVTVRSHVASILRKLDVPDRAAAVRLVERSASSS